MEILLFELGDQCNALRCAEVRGILRAATIVPLPGAPPIVEGVVNIRGTIVPVLDIRARFGLPFKPLEATDHFVVAWASSREVVLRVDRVVELRQVQPEEIQEPQDLVPGTQHVAGLVRLPDGVLLIHDLSRFLSRAEAEALDASLAEPEADEEAIS